METKEIIERVEKTYSKKALQSFKNCIRHYRNMLNIKHGYDMVLIEKKIYKNYLPDAVVYILYYIERGF